MLQTQACLNISCPRCLQVKTEDDADVSYAIPSRGPQRAPPQQLAHKSAYCASDRFSMKGRAACTALLCLRIQVARADVGGVCAAEAQAAVSGYVATDPKQFSSEGCDAVGAERYVLCDVRASEGSCASAPACASNVTISVGCHPRNANTGCCHQHLRKACPTCVPSADWCVDYCTPFSGSSPISSYPPEVHDGFCADIATLTFNSMTRERPEEVSMQGCSVPTAHAHAFCGVEGASGLCSSRPECTGLNTTSLSTCNTSGAIPTCCSVILGKQCIVCETEPVACMQSCNVDVWAEPTAFISEGSPQPAKDDIQEVCTFCRTAETSCNHTTGTRAALRSCGLYRGRATSVLHGNGLPRLWQQPCCTASLKWK